LLLVQKALADGFTDRDCLFYDPTREEAKSDRECAHACIM